MPDPARSAPAEHDAPARPDKPLTRAEGAPSRPDEAGGATYLPIEHYGAIGNLDTVALVGRNGSIDWCCLPRVDDPSVFAAILDHRKGGRFRIAPESYRWSDQRYIPGSNVLETAFETDQGRIVVTDFMPVPDPLPSRDTREIRPGANPTARPELASKLSPEIRRLIRCEEGRADMEVRWSPRFDYARAPTRIAATDTGAVATTAGGLLALGGVPVSGEVHEGPHGPEYRARFALELNERVALRTLWGATEAPCSLDETDELQQETIRSWRSWLDPSRPKGWAGRWARQVSRSALVLKLLTNPRTGAIAAAPTTSLPEQIGNVRNWDYRYCWIRDASMTVQALLALGHEQEAVDLVQWASRVADQDADPNDWKIQIAYGLEGETEFPQRELKHLEGYRGSRPVHVGNGAAPQHQLDIYGEILGGTFEIATRTGKLETHRWIFLRHLANEVVQHWRNTDHGIWEMKSGPKHYVFSKIMGWVALDRALRLAQRFELPADLDLWRSERDSIRKEVLAKGHNEDMGAFVLAYDSQYLDAANLLIPILEFLPANDPRVQGTIDRVLENLTDDGLVYRYLAPDGLPGGEGTFVACTFWLVDALALSGRLGEAREIFDRAAARASSLGLYSEEIDARTGMFLGNFPQALSHLAFVNSALYLAYAEGRDVPSVPRGTVGAWEEQGPPSDRKPSEEEGGAAQEESGASERAG